jgi:hydroxyacylglutathione hydrolase
MIFKRYVSEGLAHYSYLIADNGQATVIDICRDIDVYLEDAKDDESQIERVLKTHRNEDYLVGSCEIEAVTGAEIIHADQQWAYNMGNLPRMDGNGSLAV